MNIKIKSILEIRNKLEDAIENISENIQPDMLPTELGGYADLIDFITLAAIKAINEYVLMFNIKTLTSVSSFADGSLKEDK